MFTVIYKKGGKQECIPYVTEMTDLELDPSFFVFNTKTIAFCVPKSSIQLIIDDKNLEKE